jgi:Flp pilus assembly protein TadG
MLFRRSSSGDDQGSALLEAAIVLPVFLILVGGVFEFSFFIYQQQLIAMGVRDGARYLALTDNPDSANYQNDAKNIVVYGAPSGNNPPRVAGWTTANVTITVTALDNSSGLLAGPSRIPVVSVSTSVVDRSLGFLDLLGLKTLTINASHQERWVGGSF